VSDQFPHKLLTNADSYVIKLVKPKNRHRQHSWDLIIFLTQLTKWT